MNDLAASLGWPVEEVEAALEECMELSLVRPSWNDADRLLPVHPDVGLRALLAEEEAALLQRQREVMMGQVAVDRLVEEFTSSWQARRAAQIEQLAGIDDIRLRIQELANDCQSEAMAFITGGGLPLASRSLGRPLNEALLERGGEMRSVYLHSLYNDPASVAHVRDQVERGAKARTVAALPTRMIIFDRQHAMLPTDPDNSELGAMVFSGKTVVMLLCEFFENVWRDASPFAGSRPQRGPGERADGDDLDDRERAVVMLLGEGHTDEVVAKKLGVSVRTSRRITSELMDRLGAKSRFEAGLRVAERGWLSQVSSR
ncbi:helix-turn-helix transcriptional regulator [Streptomyces sp. APSN-46.1]|uniref:helix-turn-helix transcriptional regulator n=1 Tax=Streptomyces sp. APSN-46.1 TaxID=2929049 RepID=UPI001FB20052|nr:helix-turn-helix transcriptional regulator [Streptomyces sp. APSN-46.1]MCJ1678498.1 helix-turn-helix transcriptional regulator [Streptomyces sp. APSN-46.1]